jgi:hypothetical protein
MSESKTLSTYADPRQGLATGDNNRFLRNIWEVSKCKIGVSKWYFCSKGGTFRRWYGNIDLVVNWEIMVVKYGILEMKMGN